MTAKKVVNIKKIGNEWISTEQNGHKMSIAHHSKTSAFRSLIARNPKAEEFEITILVPVPNK